ncbi:hypothetical protein [Bradyrhizobium sp. JYMT SZCCT0428]|uniref:hypothetical protein n=1 Tax=Bradyrhizobium sp. JYMT SZCCT0428 TaxID=2807673 RepID=UPI001BADA439|nr:hypothetical protein [Bradyrhizobium sp. JYMT SZCCT0428]MBR1156118.1 hypothetical protein [Bradyrhizobium sp. JYMT SZCCT0428]
MSNAKPTAPLNILVLYDRGAISTEFVRQHLESIRIHSKHNVHYLGATFGANSATPVDLFDAVIIHFSVRLAYDWHISPHFVEQVKRFSGAKILMIQDEYEMPETACGWVRQLGIQTVFTCVPENCREKFYPADQVPGVEFVQVFTGYLPDELPDPSQIKPLAERPIHLGYRGRKLPVWFGSLGYEKYKIGPHMRAACEQRSIPSDIEWSEGKRFTGPEWYEFLGRCRAVLGTESGSNVVDKTGSIRAAIKEASGRNPKLSEAELYNEFVRPHDGEVQMNQISPKTFEAAAMKTALIHFEGEYSGLLKPHEHFIPLRKDFANIDFVLERLADVAELQAMAERTYKALCQPAKYGYQVFIAKVDAAVERNCRRPKGGTWTYEAVRYQSGQQEWSVDTQDLPSSRPVPRAPLTGGFLRSAWLRIPVKIRAGLVPVIEQIMHRRRR